MDDQIKNILIKLDDLSDMVNDIHCHTLTKDNSLKDRVVILETTKVEIEKRQAFHQQLIIALFASLLAVLLPSIILKANASEEKPFHIAKLDRYLSPIASTRTINY